MPSNLASIPDLQNFTGSVFRKTGKRMGKQGFEGQDKDAGKSESPGLLRDAPE